MTPKRERRSDAELQALYRDAGDVEPAPGLDRMIRARAEEAVEASSRRRAPWIGGLVTASVAVLAVAVVLQQPETPAGREAATPPPPPEEAFSAPAPGTARTAVPRQAEPTGSKGEKAVADRSSALSEAAELGADSAPAQAPVLGADEMLNVVRELLADERIDEARRLVQRFRERFPKREVPPEILRQLEED